MKKRVIGSVAVPWPTVGEVWLTIECPRPVSTARDFAWSVLEPLVQVLGTAPEDAQVHEIVDPEDGHLGAGLRWRVRLLSQAFPPGTTEVPVRLLADRGYRVEWPVDPEVGR